MIKLDMDTKSVIARFEAERQALAIGYFNERGIRIQLVRAPSFEEIAAAENARDREAPQ